MFRRSLTRQLFSIFQPKSFEQLKRLLRKKIRVSLGNLFDNYNHVILLSKTFQIFPAYFTRANLDKMLQSDYMEEYLHYIIATKGIHDVEDEELAKILAQMRMIKGEERRIL